MVQIRKKRPSAKNRKPLFVLMIPRFEDFGNSLFAGEITKGINLAANRLGVDILVTFCDRKDHSQWLMPTLLDPYFVDGIIFADIDRDWGVVRQAISNAIPAIVLNNATPEPYNCISIDNRSAARDVVKYLCGLGHRRIAHIAGNLETQAGFDRLEGYYEGLAAAGIDRDKHLVKKGGFLRTPARTAAMSLLKMQDRPTAVFAASDLMALEVVACAGELGFSVPGNLSVVGFDNNLTTMHSPVHLTTVEQPLMDMARLGLENLYQISLGLAKLPVKTVMQAKLVKGRTASSIK
jgi:DNA-binding LacI/PurR family transcriptional regulator